MRYQFNTVFLPAKKHSIIYAIKAAGSVGITSEELFERLWHNQDVMLSVVKSHINQINDILEETDFIIRARGRGAHARWYLEVRK